MNELTSTFLNLYFKYILLYIFLFLLGRSLVLIIQKLIFKTYNLPEFIFFMKFRHIYPVFGLIFLGNLLIVLNYLIPLKSKLIFFILFFTLLINLLNIDIKKLNLECFNINNFLFYFIIPAVLIVSSSTTNFHYDAGYYHLNHQNWLRESNLIIGMVNIFWPFGMSSISEYIYSFFWFDNSFILLHFLTLYFIHFLFLFISSNIFENKNLNLRAASLFLLIYSLLDNIGLSGGRNGFPYIQGVGKQDIAVGVLFCFVSLVTLIFIKEKNINLLEFSLLTLLTFFIFELKVSGVLIFLIYFVLCYVLYKNNIFEYSNMFLAQLPTIIFGIFWTLKSYLTTGCIIFPLNFTCINIFDWYIDNSTKAYEDKSTYASLAFMEYFKESGLSFYDWFNDFFLSSIYSDLSLFYRSVYLNFLSSLLFIYILKTYFFKKEKSTKNFNQLILLYLTSSVLYLLFYGPIPRYAIGIMLTFVGIFGFYTADEKIKINKFIVYILIVISVGLVPRANSYIEFIKNQSIAVFDPRLETLYEEVQRHENWIKPDKGDRCWINLKCTMNTENIIFSENFFFKVAYKVKQ